MTTSGIVLERDSNKAYRKDDVKLSTVSLSENRLQNSPISPSKNSIPISFFGDLGSTTTYYLMKTILLLTSFITLLAAMFLLIKLVSIKRQNQLY